MKLDRPSEGWCHLPKLSPPTTQGAPEPGWGHTYRGGAETLQVAGKEQVIPRPALGSPGWKWEMSGFVAAVGS